MHIDSVIKRDIIIYNKLKANIRAALKLKDYEKALKSIHIASNFAWQVHIGLWYDKELEDILSNIGLQLKKKIKNKQQKSNPDLRGIRIAYITSSLNDIGGHSRVLKYYFDILNEKFKDQILFITNSLNQLQPWQNLKNSLTNQGLKIYELNHNKSFVERIYKLNQLLERHAPNIIFLFIHPDDVIVIPTIIALSNKPIIYFVNHSDHSFWLGKNITDCLIEFREEGAKFSRKYRKIEVDQLIVPLTTYIKPKITSRSYFGVPEKSTFSISVGNFWKVIESSEFKYFKTIENILKKFPDHYHMLITTAHSEEFRTNNKDIRKRFIIDGPFPNLDHVYGAADFLISTFPVGGGTVKVESMACKLPLIAINNKKCSLFSFNDDLPKNYPFIASSNQEIVDFASQLIQNPKSREKKGTQLFDQYKQKLSPKIVKELLFNIINGEFEKIPSFNEESFNKSMVSYELEYVNSHIYKYPKVKSLLLNNLKYSLFSFKQRIFFFIEGLIRREFKSFIEIIDFAIIALLGRHPKY